MGEKSDTAYVEVWYSEATTDGKNKVVHKWVKPPVIIGGHYSYVTFDEIKASRGSLDYAKQMVIDYSENGSHYMKIINHGDKPIEYFIAGTHPIRELNLEGHFNGHFNNGEASPSVNHMYSYPRVLYGKIPIYYLLYPNEKPQEDKYEFNVSATGRNYSVDGDKYKRIDFSFQEDWTLEKIMNLYREEYNKKSGVLVLKFSTEDYSSDYNNYILSKGQRKYYGFVSPSDSLVSDNDVPFITEACCVIPYTNFECLPTNGEY